jgi:hypothetical protein
MTQMTVRPVAPELLALASSVNAVGDKRRVSRYPHVSHIEAAARSLEQRDVWQFVTVYRSAQTPRALALDIARGRHPVYASAGAFEARELPVGMGTGLFVKYVGGAA